MGAGGQLDRLTLVGVAGDRSVMGPVQADDLGQQVRVGGIGLRARGGVPLAVAGHRHRVDREHLVAGGDQGGDPGAAVGLDADLHQPRGLTRLEVGPGIGHLLGHQSMQPVHPLETLRQPSADQHLSCVVDDLHVVVVLGPVVSHEQHRASCPGPATLRAPSAAWRRQPAI